MATALLAVTFLLAVPPPLRAAEDSAPHAFAPNISPISQAPQRENEIVAIHVRISPPDQVGSVLLWYRGEHESVFRPYPMRHLEGEVFAARLGAWRGRGREVRYFVEARDASEARQATLGDRNAPIVVSLAAAPAVEGPGTGASVLWIAILSTALLGALLCGIRVRRRLPPPAPRPEPEESYKVLPIVVKAAGSVPTETVYLRFRADGTPAPPGPVIASRQRSRRSRLAASRTGDE
jgi:hypothetical protein